MSTPEKAPAGNGGETHAGDIAHAEQVELTARRTAAHVRRALAHDDETRAQLVELFEQLSALQALLGEWQELHHALHELLTAFSPFHANLRALGDAQAGPADGRALLQGWRPCQTRVDRLVDFERSVEHIHIPHRQGREAASRPDWGTRIAVLRREVEDRLIEEAWSTEGLLDLADEFNQTCESYLGFSDRELSSTIEKMQRAYTHLLGGLL